MMILTQERRLAAMNIAFLAAYEMFYGTLPKGLVAAVHKEILELSPAVEAPQVLLVAKSAALQWMAAQMLEDQTPAHSTDKSPTAAVTRLGAGSSKLGNAPPVKPKR